MANYYKRLKQKGYELLGKSWFVSLILVLIFLNIPLSIFSLSADLSAEDIAVIKFCDLFITVVFSIEYFLRLWTSDLSPDYKGSRIRFAMRPAMIIDLLAIVPMVHINIKPLQTFRFLRLFRILKIVEYSKPLKTMFKVFYIKMDSLVSVGLIMGLVLAVNSFLIYYFEHAAQPQVFKNIYDALWFTAMTFSTGGAGIETITPQGKFLTVFVTYSGVMLVALYSGIFASGFMEEQKKEREQKQNAR